MAPLAAYAQTASVSARDIIRLIVRLTVLIYINLFPDPQTMAQLVDQLTPLMVLSYPVACMIGYLRAPPCTPSGRACSAAPKGRRAQGAEEEHGFRAAGQRRRRALRPAPAAGGAQEEGTHLTAPG